MGIQMDPTFYHCGLLNATRLSSKTTWLVMVIIVNVNLYVLQNIPSYHNLYYIRTKISYLSCRHNSH